MSAQSTPWLTPEEYLEIETRAQFKSEYYQGTMRAMAGGSFPHNLIATNLASELRSALKGRCLVLNSDQRVRTPSKSLYAYPDVSIVCGKPVLADRDTLLNAIVVIEVLSPSTEAQDRGSKFTNYRSIGPLEEYVLVSQTEPRVERYRRQRDGSWNFTETVGLDANVRFECVDCDIALAEIYANVNFPAAE